MHVTLRSLDELFSNPRRDFLVVTEMTCPEPGVVVLLGTQGNTPQVVALYDYSITLPAWYKPGDTLRFGVWLEVFESRRAARKAFRAVAEE
jgi:hypothetical protein